MHVPMRWLNIHSRRFIWGERGARNLFILVFSACSQCCSLSSQCLLKYHLTLYHILYPKFSPSHQYSWPKGYTLHPHIEIAILGCLSSFNYLLGDWRHPKRIRMWLGVSYPCVRGGEKSLSSTVASWGLVRLVG
jgi:hypothetical protein